MVRVEMQIVQRNSYKMTIHEELTWTLLSPVVKEKKATEETKFGGSR